MPFISKIKDHFQENQLYLNRTVAATIFVIVFSLVLITRLVYLQIMQHDRYETLARNNKVRISPVPPTRGLIYDRNGILLAENIPTFSLEITPDRVDDIEGYIKNLSKIINISEANLQDFYKQLKYKSRYESIPLRTKLTEEETAKFAVEKYKFPGVEIVARLSRHYPYGHLTAHAIGYIGTINEHELSSNDIANYRGSYQIGKTGIEHYHEKTLHGSVGFSQIETDARGRAIRILDTLEAKPGENLHLSLDIKLQEIACKQLANKLGAIVAIDTKTGGILALVSNPSFDPNIFSSGVTNQEYKKLRNNVKRPLFNRAIQGQYPPGSTVKPIIALQALDNNIITPSTYIYDPGYYKINNDSRLFRGWNIRGHGKINLENAIAESCATFFYYLAERLGINKIHDIFDRFGLGKPTGIDLTGEAAGIAPSSKWKKYNKHEPWYTGETLNVGIGQGYTLTTPIQMANMAALIANKGVNLKPFLVQMSEEYNIKTPNIK